MIFLKKSTNKASWFYVSFRLFLLGVLATIYPFLRAVITIFYYEHPSPLIVVPPLPTYEHTASGMACPYQTNQEDCHYWLFSPSTYCNRNLAMLFLALHRVPASGELQFSIWGDGTISNVQNITTTTI